MTKQSSFNDLIKLSMYSAKISSLLAKENISVEFSDSAKTASYSPLSHTIVFPYSTAFMDTDVHELFMFHECSHAIHLKLDDSIKMFKSPVDHMYFNIIIDIRDERLIKDLYPGSKPVFVRGYEKLVANGFFGEKADIALRGFPDRLNVFAKCGMAIGSFVPMSSDEMAFYDRCMMAVTTDELIALSAELSTMEHQYAIDDEEAVDVLKSRNDDEELSEEELNDMISKQLDELREKRVQDIFNESFESSILSNAKVISFEQLPDGYAQTCSVSEYTEYVSLNTHDAPEALRSIRDMRRDIKMSVDSMVRVFESKKAAEKMRNAKISDTGMIDMNKVHRYRVDNKIFRRATRIPNSKNHAYVILIDMSGSMYEQFNNVIQQIVVITEFFRRIQVPYKIYGFGMHVNEEIFTIKSSKYHQTAVFAGNYFDSNYTVYPNYLFEVMNSEQTMLEHNTSIHGLMNRIGFSLGGTPTNHAICAAENIANKFFGRVKADRKHIVVITDGEPTDGLSRTSRTTIITDPITRKNVVYTGNSPYGHCNALGKIIDYRSDIKFSTISLTKSFNDTIVSSFVSASADPKNIEEFKKMGYTKIDDPFTKNPIFFAKPTVVDTGVDEFDISGKKTSSQISRVMISNMKHVNKSRIFLNALVESLC